MVRQIHCVGSRGVTLLVIARTVVKSAPPRAKKALPAESSGSDTEPEYDIDPFVEEVGGYALE